MNGGDRPPAGSKPPAASLAKEGDRWRTAAGLAFCAILTLIWMAGLYPGLMIVIKGDVPPAEQDRTMPLFISAAFGLMGTTILDDILRKRHRPGSRYSGLSNRKIKHLLHLLAGQIAASLCGMIAYVWYWNINPDRPDGENPYILFVPVLVAGALVFAWANIVSRLSSPDEPAWMKRLNARMDAFASRLRERTRPYAFAPIGATLWAIMLLSGLAGERLPLLIVWSLAGFAGIYGFVNCRANRLGNRKSNRAGVISLLLGFIAVMLIPAIGLLIVFVAPQAWMLALFAGLVAIPMGYGIIQEFFELPKRRRRWDTFSDSTAWPLPARATLEAAWAKMRKRP